jgi:hypothetical protein
MPPRITSDKITIFTNIGQKTRESSDENISKAIIADNIDIMIK